MKRKAKIYYTALDDFWRKEEKLQWLRDNPLPKIEFERLEPDAKHNWINQADTDFEILIPLFAMNEEGIFNLFGNRIKTNRDDWVYDYEIKSLVKKIEYFTQEYNKQQKTNGKDINKNENNIKWSGDLLNKLQNSQRLVVDKEKIIQSSWRPFIKRFFYAEKVVNDRMTDNHYRAFGTTLLKDNIAINISDTNSGKPFSILATSQIADYHFISDTKFITLYHYDSENQKHENITDWALNQFQTNYKKAKGAPITKQDIFYYTYGVLHSTQYRKKYEQNLKREFPRLPFYADFRQWRDWGEQLMDLHINYETQKPFALGRKDLDLTAKKKNKTPNLFDDCPKDNNVIASGDNPTLETKNNAVPERDEQPAVSSSPSAKEISSNADDGFHPSLLYSSASPTNQTFTAKPKTKLRADKTNGTIEIDSHTTLTGVPPIAWEYKLGNRSAIEWVLDQYKEKKPSDATIAERFNTYKFEDYKEQVIDLLRRVCNVSIETMEIVNQMPQE